MTLLLGKGDIAVGKRCHCCWKKVTLQLGKGDIAVGKSVIAVGKR